MKYLQKIKLVKKTECIDKNTTSLNGCCESLVSVEIIKILISFKMLVSISCLFHLPCHDIAVSNAS